MECEISNFEFLLDIIWNWKYLISNWKGKKSITSSEEIVKKRRKDIDFKMKTKSY